MTAIVTLRSSATSLGEDRKIRIVVGAAPEDWVGSAIMVRRAGLRRTRCRECTQRRPGFGVNRLTQPPRRVSPPRGPRAAPRATGPWRDAGATYVTFVEKATPARALSRSR